MEIVLMVLGAVALFLLLFAGAIALGVSVAMWRAWWLHPLWSLVIVPLGLQQIGYWQFVALSMFIAAFSSMKPEEERKGESASDKWGRLIGRVVMLFAWPVVTFYFIHWYLR